MPGGDATVMRLVLVHQPTPQSVACPYRLFDEQDQEIVWVNDFLDARHVRQLSPRSLRAYPYDLLHFARWLSKPASDSGCHHRVHPVGLCSSSTEPTATTHTANHQSSFDRNPLFVSLPSRTGDSRRPFPFPAPLYHTLPGRLRPPPSHPCLWSPSSPHAQEGN